MLLAYLGPDAVLPLTSTLAAVAGFGLMFGRHVGRFLLLGVTAAARRARPDLRADGPTAPRPQRATTRPDKVAT